MGEDSGRGVTQGERYTGHSHENDSHTVYTRESTSTGWFVGIIVALGLLAIAYLVFSANSQPSTAPAPVYSGLFGATVVGDGQALLLKKESGTCVSLAFKQEPKVVDCPTADPASP